MTHKFCNLYKSCGLGNHSYPCKMVKKTEFWDKKHKISEMRSLSNTPRFETRQSLTCWMVKYLEIWS